MSLRHILASKIAGCYVQWVVRLKSVVQSDLALWLKTTVWGLRKYPVPSHYPSSPSKFTWFFPSCFFILNNQTLLHSFVSLCVCVCVFGSFNSIYFPINVNYVIFSRTQNALKRTNKKRKTDIVGGKWCGKIGKMNAFAFDIQTITYTLHSETFPYWMLLKRRLLFFATVTDAVVVIVVVFICPHTSFFLRSSSLPPPPPLPSPPPMFPFSYIAH